MSDMTVTLDGMQGRVASDGTVNFGSDSNLNVNFFKKPVLNERKSREAGRLIHDGVDFVRIQHPGEKDYTERPVAANDQIKWRFPKLWENYEKNQKQIPDGTPIDMLFVTHPEIGMNLRAVGIHTVEQLAVCSSDALQRIGIGGQQFVNKAQEYLAMAQKGVAHHEMAKQLEERDNTIAVLQNQMNQLKDTVNRLQSAQAGVPVNMMPPQRLSMAQDMANAAPQPMPMAMPIDNGPLPEPMDISDWGGDAPSEDTSDAPKRTGGWPKGRPRSAA